MRAKKRFFIFAPISECTPTGDSMLSLRKAGPYTYIANQVQTVLAHWKQRNDFLTLPLS